ncbi:MAG: RNA 2',3'-cyclic phosphodiesterase [Candidatus Omnitrophica bacterium]|nr:RNA 2',3'-cyclic phosphodiesterase [Candidatus Omnitrophota bacterium]
MMRAFIAIDLPEHVRSSLAKLEDELAQSGADVKWVRPAQLHVTLKFLGEISEGERQAIEALVARVAASEAPFATRLNALGAFPSLTAPRVVWVGLGEGGEAVARIAEAIEREGVAIPLRKEERAFSPHITLGRVRSLRGRQALVAALRDARWDPPPPWRVSSVTLYESVLRPGGPQHTVLAELPLVGKG